MIAPGGGYVAFDSPSYDLVSNDTNDMWDIFEVTL